MKKFLKSLMENPIYIKDQAINRRLDGKKRFNFPEYWGYIGILALPLVYLVFAVAGAETNDYKYYWQDWSKTSLVILVFAQMIYFIMKAISKSFSLFARERENKTYMDLIATLMSPGEILKGKFFIAFYPIFMELTAFFPLFFVECFFLNLGILKIVGIYIITLIIAIFFILLGLFASVISSNSSRAHSISTLVTGFIILGTLIIDSLLTIISTNHDFIPFTVFLNPGLPLTATLFGTTGSDSWFTLAPFITPVILFTLSLIFWNMCLGELEKLPEI